MFKLNFKKEEKVTVEQIRERLDMLETAQQEVISDSLATLDMVDSEDGEDLLKRSQDIAARQLAINFALSRLGIEAVLVGK